MSSSYKHVFASRKLRQYLSSYAEKHNGKGYVDVATLIRASDDANACEMMMVSVYFSHISVSRETGTFHGMSEEKRVFVSLLPFRPQYQKVHGNKTQDTKIVHSPLAPSQIKEDFLDAVQEKKGDSTKTHDRAS